MKTSDIIVAPKMSKLDWDRYRHGLSTRDVLRNYHRDGVDVKRVLGSHEHQQEVLKKLKVLLKGARFVSREDLSWKRLMNGKLVISVGGDNHFQYVSHHVGNAMMTGINSDPRRSEGFLVSFNLKTFEESLESILRGKYRLEKWARLDVRINGQKIKSRAVSEIYIGECRRSDMSRHVLMLGKQREEQKCSGLLVSTGSGSTGWYDSAVRYLYPKGNRFSKKSVFFRYLVMEPYEGNLSKFRRLHGSLHKGMTLKIQSLNDTRGILVIDSQEEHPFREGNTAVIRMAAPLKVIVGV